MFWAVILLIIAFFGFISGLMTCYKAYNEELSLPDKFKWFSGFYGPHKGSKWLIFFVGIIWSMLWVFILFAVMFEFFNRI